ncbi:MAG: hypothetical protein ACOY4R_16240 [Pseudomonadota bacterium]
MREDLREARAELQAKPDDEMLVKQVRALESFLKGVQAKVEMSRRRAQEA